MNAQPIPNERTGSGENVLIKCVLCGHHQLRNMPVHECESRETIIRATALKNDRCDKCGERK